MLDGVLFLLRKDALHAWIQLFSSSQSEARSSSLNDKRKSKFERVSLHGGAAFW